MDKVKWGIIGLGTIANEFASVFESEQAELVAVASRSLQKAQQFAKKHQVPKAYGNYGALLFDPDIDVVYIATPNSYHFQGVKDALNQGKHVLCEKALFVNQAEFDEAAALAEEKGLILAEAMTIYHMPLLKTIKEEVEKGAIGKVRMIQASFGIVPKLDAGNRFFNPKLGGGALFDIGVYALTFVRYFMSSQPTDIKSIVNLYETGVDEQAAVILKNEDQEIGTVSMSFRGPLPQVGVISGEEGHIVLENYPRPSKATLTRLDGSTETFTDADRNWNRALLFEMEAMSESILTGKNQMSFHLSKDVMALMDALAAEWGMDVSLGE